MITKRSSSHFSRPSNTARQAPYSRACLCFTIKLKAMIYRMVRPKNKIFPAPVAAGKISLSYSYSQTQIKPSLQAMKKPFTFSVLLCALFCLLHVSSSRAACKPAAAIAQTADYSCSYFDDMTGKYYCVETSAACDVAHAFVKESGSTGSPTL